MPPSTRLILIRSVVTFTGLALAQTLAASLVFAL